jgi:hypothetical protein
MPAGLVALGSQFRVTDALAKKALQDWELCSVCFWALCRLHAESCLAGSLALYAIWCDSVSVLC